MNFLPSLLRRLLSEFGFTRATDLRRTLQAALILCLLLSLIPAVGLADSITLKNGDHLTGTVTQLDGGKLAITTSYAGSLNITMDEVTSVKLDKPLILPLENKVGGKKLEITGIERTASGLVVSSATGPEPVPPGGLTTLRTATAQQAYEDSLHPGWGHAWVGNTNISLAIAKGNSDTTSFGTGINLNRQTRKDKSSLYLSTLYTHDGIQNATTANTTTSGLRYDHNISPKIFVFGTTDFATNALQDLDLRTVVGGGFGWHALANKKQQFDVFGGVVWTHENYGAVAATTANPTATPATTNSFAALDLGQQFTRKLGSNSAFTEQAYIFPNLQDTSQFRFTLNSALDTRISKYFSWHTAFTDVYVTNPPTGTKNNDVLFTTGLGFTFQRK